MRLYIEGHSAGKGYAVSREWSDAECSRMQPKGTDDLSPVRYIPSFSRALEFVHRYNRRFATH